MRATSETRWLAAFRTFLVLAFVARALVPPGYMFASAGEAGAKIVLCTTHGMVEAFYDPETGAYSPDKSPTKSKPGGDPPCAFGALAKLALPSTSLTVTALAFVEPRLNLPESVSPGRGLGAPPFSTGPPSLSA